MALEAVIYQKDPFIYACKDYNYDMGLAAYAFAQEHNPNAETIAINGGELWDSPPSSVAQNTTSSPETYAGGDHLQAAAAVPAQVAVSRRKRRRTKSMKNKEEMESQRMTHIAVERNRRRQMNDYLAVLRSLMPPSYAQRGDQASIVGGAINFVKELEQLLQFLEAHKSTNQEDQFDASTALSKFFTFPQYSTRPPAVNSNGGGAAVEAAEKQSRVADIEVAMVESHANIKILAKRRPKQLLKMVSGLQSLCLSVLHLNITTVDQSVLYAFSVKVEDDCQLTTVNEIATALHEMVAMIEEEEESSTRS